MNKLKFFLPVLAIIFLAASCSKDARIERRLTKKDGKWNIEQYTYSYTYDGQTEVETYANAGSFIFDDNTFIWTTSIDGDSDSFGGTWSNTDDQLSLIVDGDVITFNIEDDSRKEMTLKYTDISTYDGVTEKDEVTLKLKRD